MQIETGMYIFQHHAIMSEMLGHAKVFRYYQGMNDKKVHRIRENKTEKAFSPIGCVKNDKS